MAEVGLIKFCQTSHAHSTLSTVEMAENIFTKNLKFIKLFICFFVVFLIRLFAKDQHLLSHNLDSLPIQMIVLYRGASC